VEKIPFIHSSVGVYYHHYPFFLSKLTKEGKVPERGQALRDKANTTRTCFCLQKKSEAHRRGKHDGNDDAYGHRSGCKRLFEFERRHCSTSAWSTGRTRRR
jgi:hypothetical protein